MLPARGDSAGDVGNELVEIDPDERPHSSMDAPCEAAFEGVRLTLRVVRVVGAVAGGFAS